MPFDGVVSEEGVKICDLANGSDSVRASFFAFLASLDACARAVALPLGFADEPPRAAGGTTGFLSSGVGYESLRVAILDETDGMSPVDLVSEFKSLQGWWGWSV